MLTWASFRSGLTSAIATGLSVNDFRQRCSASSQRRLRPLALGDVAHHDHRAGHGPAWDAIGWPLTLVVTRGRLRRDVELDVAHVLP